MNDGSERTLLPRRVAIVTGGAFGIGRASCQLLAENGWSIVSVDRHHERNAETVSAIIEAGGVARSVVGDVADSRTAKAACGEAKELGGLRALVNAAAMRHAGSILDITEREWDETLAACLRGAFVFTRATIPLMAEAGGGSIVNFSSQSALVHKENIAYASAKAALETFTRCLAVDHLAEHIRANAIIPPFTITGMTDSYSPEALAERDARSPSGHVARPEDLAQMVRFLVSDQSSTLTGGIFGTTLPLSIW